jgi:Family of unknown function (DUF5681)
MSDYDVGYGKTPEHSRYKKGQSGNPVGRPKKRKAIDSASIMNKILDESAIINVDGKQLKITKREAFHRILLKQATEGKSSSIKAVLRIAEEGVAVEGFVPDDLDAELLKNFIDRQLEVNDEP